MSKTGASKRIIFFTKYSVAGPSSRYRSYQYFPFYEKEGFDIICYPLFPTSYVEGFYKKNKKMWWLLLPQYAGRFLQLLFLKKYNIVYIEQELFPFIPLFIEKILLKNKKNIILDYDDATFHTYDNSQNRLIRSLCGGKIYKLVQLASVVITGSPYLTKILGQYAEKVIEIPTSISLNNYNGINKKLPTDKGTFRIGWIGSKTTSINISLVTDAIKEIQSLYKNTELVLIGFDKSLLPILSEVQFRFIEWNAKTEVEDISSFDVGIMPLENNYFNKGKCGFKLIQYMACGIPTVSTPLEANVKINHDNKNLFAESPVEWINCFKEIINDRLFYEMKVGARNKEIVHEYYSVETNFKRYIHLFYSLISN